MSTHTNGAPAAPDTRVLGRRAAAAIVDQLLLGVVLAPAIAPGAIASFLPDSRFRRLLDLLAGGETSEGVYGFLADTGLLAIAVVGIPYFAIMEGRRGQTLGKMALGIRVVREDGGRVGAGAAALRTLMRGVDGLGLYLLGFVVALLSKKRRRLGDMAAKTLVVRA